MLVKSLEYVEYEGTPQQWNLEESTFGDINLIVGENASGKSRVLNLISNLADFLSGGRGIFLSANYKMNFDNHGGKIDYALKCERSIIIEESLDINSENLLSRGADGIGKIYYQQEKKPFAFQAPPNQVVSVAKRDAIQHPFLGYLYDWGKSVRRYYFGTDLGKSHLLVPMKVKEGVPPQELNPKNTNIVVAMFIEGQKKFSKQFTDVIIKNMGAIGYELTEIGSAPPISIIFEGAPGDVVGLYVREADLSATIDQNAMSQGMFRALSLIIQITYSEFTGKPDCILIDDIGEGLDYNRSTALVKLLIEKAKNASIQLIMATNDRFVMNNVSLEYWSVTQRIGSVCKILDYRNSPDLFKEFELTGLSNFDFFSSRYYLKGNNQK